MLCQQPIDGWHARGIRSAGMHAHAKAAWACHPAIPHFSVDRALRIAGVGSLESFPFLHPTFSPVRGRADRLTARRTLVNSHAGNPR
jgi:hypothetical protein